MANQVPPFHGPDDPYANWRESVLSTRSLSYLSMITDIPGFDRSRQASLAHSRHPTRKNTLTSESDYDLEMAAPPPKHDTNMQDTIDTPEQLPTSVANSPLFILPREIRDRIYSFCLTTAPDKTTSPANPRMLGWPNPNTALLTNTPSDRWPAPFSLQPQLLRTCHIIYAEAARQLYTQNHFSFDHPSDANVFARALAAPQHTSHITKVALQIKIGELRLWMPYITSTDGARSLKADFPRLKELWVRYRSSHWSSNLSAEANLRIWDDDSKLNEIVDGLRHVYLAPPMELADPVQEMEEFERHVARNPGVIRIDSEVDFKQQLLDFQKAKYAWKLKSSPAVVPPVIRVVSVCRISTAHDGVLSGELPAGVDPGAPQPQHQGQGQGAQHGVVFTHFNHNHPGHALAVQQHQQAQQTQQAQEADPEVPAAPLIPVREGEKYRGFTTIDLKEGHRTVVEEDKGQTTRITRTPFASKDGIMLALMVYSMYGPRTSS